MNISIMPDRFHYGNAVTVRDGAVYSHECGVVARVDARDGRVEWLTFIRAHAMRA